MKLALNMRAGSISTLTSQKDTKTLFHKMFDAHFEEHDTIMPWSNQQRERRPRANVFGGRWQQWKIHDILTGGLSGTDQTGDKSDRHTLTWEPDSYTCLQQAAASTAVFSDAIPKPETSPFLITDKTKEELKTWRESKVQDKDGTDL